MTQVQALDSTKATRVRDILKERNRPSSLSCPFLLHLYILVLVLVILVLFLLYQLKRSMVVVESHPQNGAIGSLPWPRDLLTGKKVAQLGVRDCPFDRVVAAVWLDLPALVGSPLGVTDLRDAALCEGGEVRGCADGAGGAAGSEVEDAAGSDGGDAVASEVGDAVGGGVGDGVSRDIGDAAGRDVVGAAVGDVDVGAAVIGRARRALVIGSVSIDGQCVIASGGLLAEETRSWVTRTKRTVTVIAHESAVIDGTATDTVSVTTTLTYAVAARKATLRRAMATPSDTLTTSAAVRRLMEVGHVGFCVFSNFLVSCLSIACLCQGDRLLRCGRLSGQLCVG
ncbi:hypothetical protein K505DRAFT_2319 [Melanomma pulvis-pyrius CBS 109.77]|uniref:Uncharacterized protein n=1 Tax=Melanomma pulvis-pyrius CBS 109.77 TaxID=1314802 RepID=A0A6A6XI63_9PLEO|nr:hypothetical protein K505DRAFT_2319 [Melanomma pulvis-pyrius CBS 109.77]